VRVVDDDHCIPELGQVIRRFLRSAVVGVSAKQAHDQRLALFQRQAVAYGNAQAVGPMEREQCLQGFDALRVAEIQMNQILVINAHPLAGQRQNPVDCRLIVGP